MNPERLMLILLAPVVSEKSTLVGDQNNQVPFRVLADATKPEIKAAAESALTMLMKHLSILKKNMRNTKAEH